MGGGLLQLVAYGAQDIYLTGNPQITFFKVIYRRHTNFSMECVQQSISGPSTISATTTQDASVIISRNGDLLHQVWVRCDQDSTDGICGDYIIEEAEIEIGGQRIDKHSREWNQVWAELTTPVSKSDGYKYLTGGFQNTLVTKGVTNQQSIMVPLQFWFCRDIGLALPLIALQYHEVNIKFTWGSGAATTPGMSRKASAAVTPAVEVWADYIYLDTDERRRFAQVSHEYLIEQLQIQEEGDSVTEYKLNFEHPIKELIWTTVSTSLTTQKVKLELNGHDRFPEQTREYFQIKQPLVHHTSVPGYNIKEKELSEFVKPFVAPVVTHSTSITETPNTTSADEISIGGALASITTDTAMVATNHSSNVLGATSAAGMGFVIKETGENTTIEYKIGDIIDVFHNDQNVDTTDSQRHHCYRVEAATGILLVAAFGVNEKVQAVTVDRSMVTENTHLGANAPGAAGDKFIITRIGASLNPKSRCSQLVRDINVYSFAIHPEDHQPSGTCNFSKIDHAKLMLSAAGTISNIYAVNYNVLRIMSGMGGLAYSS